MSFHAVSWAIKQRAGSPSAKAVLWSIASYAGDEWSSFPKQETIARDSEQSLDSVQRRLVDLIGLGLVRRLKLKRFGRRTHDFFILQPSAHFAAPLEQILLLLPTSCDVMDDSLTAPAESSPNAAADCGSVETSQENAQPLEPSTDSPIPPDSHAAADCGSAPTPSTLPQSAPHATALVRQHELVKEPRIPPQPPQGGAFNEVLEKRFEQFKIGYPDGIVDPMAARAEFAKLREADQLGAIAGLSVYAARLKSRREKSLKAHLYLRKRSWEGILASVPAEGSPVVGGPYEPSSEVGRALMVLARIARSSHAKLGDNRLIYTHPITPQLMALARSTDDPWETYPFGSKNFFAWREFIAAHLSNFARLTEITAPWPWPPKADGTVYSGSDPPAEERVDGMLATEDDLEEMAKG